jgi:hypothetical protein
MLGKYMQPQKHHHFPIRSPAKTRDIWTSEQRDVALNHAFTCSTKATSVSVVRNDFCHRPHPQWTLTTPGFVFFPESKPQAERKAVCRLLHNRQARR